jgi:membrane-associated phospholipid phosphatase
VVLVGADRVFLGAHFISDVVAGWALGGAVVLALLPALLQVRGDPTEPERQLSEL